MGINTSEGDLRVPIYYPDRDAPPETAATFLKLMSENGGRWAELYESVSGLGNNGLLLLSYITRGEIDFSETSVDYEISYEGIANRVKAFKQFYSLE